MGLKLPTFLYIMSCDLYYASYLDQDNSNPDNSNFNSDNYVVGVV